MQQSIEDMIGHMVNLGTSLTIGWSADTGCYEVGWTVGAKRFRGVNRDLSTAMRQATANAAERLGVPI